MTNTPFSVVISVYYKDDAEFFDRALLSITEEQIVKPSEIVLVCDGPLNEELDRVIEKNQKKYDCFKIIRLPENTGLGNALRIAVENASNDLIARMDSDDISLPSRFEQQLVFFEKCPDIDIVGGDIIEFIDDSEKIASKRSVPTTDSEIRKYMEKRCALNHVTVMYKKNAVMRAGGYLDWFWNEDYYLWIRMMLTGAIFANTGTVLVKVRVGRDMYQRRGGVKYFLSEYGLQKLMLEKKIISFSTFIANVFKRFVVQIAMPNSIREWAFKNFARTKGE